MLLLIALLALPLLGSCRLPSSGRLSQRNPNSVMAEEKPKPYCPSRYKQYTDSANVTYDIFCGLDFAWGKDLEVSSQGNFSQCVDRCSVWNRETQNPSRCTGIVFNTEDQKECFLKASKSDQYVIGSRDAAYIFEPRAAGSNCPADDGVDFTYEGSPERYEINCGHEGYGTDLAQYSEQLLGVCSDKCKLYNDNLPPIKSIDDNPAPRCKSASLIDGTCYLRSSNVHEESRNPAINAIVVLDAFSPYKGTTTTPTSTSSTLVKQQTTTVSLSSSSTTSVQKSTTIPTSISTTSVQKSTTIPTTISTPSILTSTTIPTTISTPSVLTSMSTSTTSSKSSFQTSTTTPTSSPSISSSSQLTTQASTSPNSSPSSSQSSTCSVGPSGQCVPDSSAVSTATISSSARLLAMEDKNPTSTSATPPMVPIATGRAEVLEEINAWNTWR